MTRLEAYCKSLGWAGGTIHQVATFTGCSVNDLLYRKVPVAEQAINSDYTSGWFAGRTCSVNHNYEKVFPKYTGNINFWVGLAIGLRYKHSIGVKEVIA